MKSYARVSPSNNCVYSFYLGEVALCRISFLTTWKRSLRNFHQPGPCETSCSSLLPFPAGAWKEAKELGGYLKFLHRQLKKLPLGFEAHLSQVCVFVFAFYHFMFFSMVNKNDVQADSDAKTKQQYRLRVVPSDALLLRMGKNGAARCRPVIVTWRSFTPHTTVHAVDVVGGHPL